MRKVKSLGKTRRFVIYYSEKLLAVIPSSASFVSGWYRKDARIYYIF